MSVVFVLGLMLVVGYVAVGLVGFFGWRRRMREGLRVSDRQQAA